LACASANIYYAPAYAQGQLVLPDFARSELQKNHRIIAIAWHGMAPSKTRQLRGGMTRFLLIKISFD
jgi:hypothetical protein